MKAISEQLTGLGAVRVVEDIGKLTEEEATSAFTSAIGPLFALLYPNSTRKRARLTEKSMATLYRHVNRAKKAKKRRRVQEMEAVSSQLVHSERPAE
jgi:hypothetical protein